MNPLLKQLLEQRGVLSMEEGKPESEEKKEEIGDGGSTPDGSEAEPGEVEPTTPVDEVPPTGEVPSKEEEEEEEEEPGEEGKTQEPGEGAGENSEEPPTGEESQTPPEETPNPDAGGAEPPSEEDDFGDDEDEDEDDFEEEDLDDTVEALSETQKADIAMINLIDKVRETLADGGLSGREASLVADRAGAILGKIDIEASPSPAMECFGSFGARRTNTELALEALEEDQKAVEQKKEGLIERIMKFIRELARSLFGNKEIFKRQAAAAAERAVKIEGNTEVTIKGQEGYTAGYAAMVGKDRFSCSELSAAMDRLSQDVSGLVAKFIPIAGNDDCPEDFVEAFVSKSRVLSHLGFNRDAYVEATKAYESRDVVIAVNAEQQKQMVVKFTDAFNNAENLMSRVESTAKRACAAGNNKQLNEILAVLRMFGNLAKSGPTLAIRLTLGKKEAA